jgi:hypothetical protein
MRIRQSRLAPHGAIESRQGLLRPMQFQKHAAPAAKRLGAIGAQLQGGVKTQERLVRALERAQGTAAISMGSRVRGIQPKRTFVGVDGGGIVLDRQPGIPAVEQRFGVVRLRQQDALVACERLARAIEIEQRVAAAELRRNEVGAESQSAIIALKRFFGLVQGQQCIAEQRLGNGLDCIVLQRALERGSSLRGAIRLKFDDPAQQESIGMRRLMPENLPAH